jgi:arylsulfatase A-like enzyme
VDTAILRSVSAQTDILMAENMDRRTFLATPAMAAATSGSGFAMQQSPASKPNVIWILGDQHRAQALGCAGDPNARTPHIDNLARDGVHFTNAISGFPLCCPFRGSMLTGRYPHHCVRGHEYAMPEGQPTIAQPFRQAGYHTAYFGKWHVDGWHEADGRAAMHIIPPEQRGGFDEWTGYSNNNSQYDSWVHGGTGKDAFHYRLPGYETDELTNLLIKYIKDRAADKKPFFAALSVQPPHDPYVAPEPFSGNFNPAGLQLRPNVPAVKSIVDTARNDLAGYYGMIENLDWNLGRLRKALDEAGLRFNTHIVFFSDHGDMHGSHGQFRKTSPYEESLRVPFIIAGEQPRYDGRVNGKALSLLNHVDIAPTTLGLAGIAKPSWMEGADYSRHRFARRNQSPQNEPDSAFIQAVVPTGHGNSVNKPWRGVVTNDGWKYVCFENTSWLMFNLDEDPYELVNVAHNNVYRARRKKLIERLNQWISDTGDKFAVPAD